jgi:phosphoglycolate phosphatase
MTTDAPHSPGQPRPAPLRPVVVFDLDGTLVDTAPDLIAALNAILMRENMPPVRLEDARSLIGGGARKLLERGLALEGRMVEEPHMSALVSDFIAHYADNIAHASRPFEGTLDTLDTLENAGFALAVCTNKLEWLSLRLLDQLGLSPRFSAICGADTFGIAKPAAGGLIKTIQRAGGEIPHAIMIGDSATDIRAARAAGIPVVAVDFGYTEIPVRELGPDRVISHMRELPDAISALISRAR